MRQKISNAVNAEMIDTGHQMVNGVSKVFWRVLLNPSKLGSTPDLATLVAAVSDALNQSFWTWAQFARFLLLPKSRFDNDAQIDRSRR